MRLVWKVSGATSSIPFVLTSDFDWYRHAGVTCTDVLLWHYTPRSSLESIHLRRWTSRHHACTVYEHFYHCQFLAHSWSGCNDCSRPVHGNHQCHSPRTVYNCTTALSMVCLRPARLDALSRSPIQVSLAEGKGWSFCRRVPKIHWWQQFFHAKLRCLEVMVGIAIGNSGCVCYFRRIIGHICVWWSVWIDARACWPPVDVGLLYDCDTWASWWMPSVKLKLPSHQLKGCIVWSYCHKRHPWWHPRSAKLIRLGQRKVN